ncbi:VanW family protein [Parasphingorhabdus pacifica]
MPEDNDQPQPGARSDAGGERATDPLRTNQVPAPAPPAGDAGGGGPEDSTEQTTQISRVDPTDDEMREAMRSAAVTERVAYEPPEAASERTETISAVPPATQQFSGSIPQPTAGSGDERTETFSAPPAAGTPAAGGTAVWAAAGGAGGGNQPPPQPPTGPPGPGGDPGPGDGKPKRPGMFRAGVIAGIAAGVLALLYIGDLALTSGQVPRGTVVADVEIGGLSEAAAESKLRNELSTSLDEPVRVRVGEAQTSIDPEAAGLEMDWSATVNEVGEQSWNPISRLTSFFTTREVDPVTHGNRAQVREAIAEVSPRLNREASEGTVEFDGVTPKAVDPVVGRSVDVDAATEAVISLWAAPGAVALPYEEQQVSTTREGVRQALENFAKPAVSAPVKVQGEGKDAELAPEEIAKALRFEPNGQGGLKASVDVPAAVAGVEPELAETMRPSKDARIVLEGGKPKVHPSVDGHGINWEKSFEKLNEVLRKDNDRNVKAIYQEEPAEFTTEQADKLGIKEVVSEFQTGGFEEASGVNIKRTAEEVNGAIIKPGETFSLNGHTGPRGKEQGYVESGIIKDGRPGKAVGGGISQFATTLYNASYFAGMKDIEHKEHSYYISRYPEGREATVFQSPDGTSIIDVKFKNTTDYGIMITTEWTPSSINVKFWSTKFYDVSSQTGERSNPTPPEVVAVPPGEPCSPSKGTPGFTVHDTRTLKNVKTGEVTKQSPTKTVYEPQPIVHCGPPPSPGAGPPPR